MEEKFIIRRMVESDVDEVHALDVLSFSLPWPERAFRHEVMQNPAMRGWVVERTAPDGSAAIVGMTVCWLIIDEAEVGTFAIHPDYRQRGLGRQLLAQALLDLYEGGARQVFLEVRRGNLPAQALYASMGFEMFDVRKRYYRDNGEDALIMRLGQMDEEAFKRFIVNPK